MVRACILLDDELFYWDVVPAWERSFGIRFAQHDFAQATTVGDIWAVVERHVIARIGPNPSELGTACATQRTFYQLRRALMAQGFTRSELLPQSQLRALLPWRKRHRMWRTLQQTSGLELPRLQMPALLFVALWAVSAAIFWATLTLPGWGIVVMSGLAVAVIISQLRWVCWVFPAATLGGLASELPPTHYHTLSHPYVRNNLGEVRDMVLAGLARCSAESTDISLDELYDGTRLAW